MLFCSLLLAFASSVHVPENVPAIERILDHIQTRSLAFHAEQQPRDREAGNNWIKQIASTQQNARHKEWMNNMLFSINDLVKNDRELEIERAYRLPNGDLEVLQVQEGKVDLRRYSRIKLLQRPPALASLEQSVKQILPFVSVSSPLQEIADNLLSLQSWNWALPKTRVIVQKISSPQATIYVVAEKGYIRLYPIFAAPVPERNSLLWTPANVEPKAVLLQSMLPRRADNRPTRANNRLMVRKRKAGVYELDDYIMFPPGSIPSKWLNLNLRRVSQIASIITKSYGNTLDLVEALDYLYAFEPFKEFARSNHINGGQHLLGTARFDGAAIAFALDNDVLRTIIVGQPPARKLPRENRIASPFRNDLTKARVKRTSGTPERHALMPDSSIIISRRVNDDWRFEIYRKISRDLIDETMLDALRFISSACRVDPTSESGFQFLEEFIREKEMLRGIDGVLDLWTRDEDTRGATVINKKGKIAVLYFSYDS